MNEAEDNDDIPITSRETPLLPRAPIDYPALLKTFPTEELKQEIRRRNKANRKRPFKPCDECKHFIQHTSSKNQGSIDTYNPCAKGHKMDFQNPSDDPSNTEWGLTRNPCKDRRKPRAKPN